MQKKRALTGLVDVVFGFAYDQRTTLGDSTCESAWTVAKLSPTLSWFDTQSSVHQVLSLSLSLSLCACVCVCVCAMTKKDRQTDRQIDRSSQKRRE